MGLSRLEKDDVHKARHSLQQASLGQRTIQHIPGDSVKVSNRKITDRSR